MTHSSSSQDAAPSAAAAAEAFVQSLSGALPAGHTPSALPPLAAEEVAAPAVSSQSAGVPVAASALIALPE
jgi:hypothetical protein